MNEHAILQLLQQLEANYPPPPRGITEEVINSWLMVFQAKGIEAHQLPEALGQFLASEERFFPTPGVFLSVSKLTENSDQQTEKAWSELWRIVKTVGRYPEAGHEDRALNQAILTCGGIQRFCDQNEEEVNYLKAEFRSAYQGALRMAPENLPESWAGEVNRLNNIAGRQSHDERILISYHQPVAQLGYDPISDSPKGIGSDRTPTMQPKEAEAMFKALLGAAKLKSDAENTQREEARKAYEERMQTLLHETAAKRIRKKRITEHS